MCRIFSSRNIQNKQAKVAKKPNPNSSNAIANAYKNIDDADSKYKA